MPQPGSIGGRMLRNANNRLAFCGRDEPPPPPATGACCVRDGNCIPGLTQQQCVQQGGEWQGPQTTCEPNPCPLTPCFFAYGNYCAPFTSHPCDAPPVIYVPCFEPLKSNPTGQKDIGTFISAFGSCYIHTQTLYERLPPGAVFTRNFEVIPDFPDCAVDCCPGADCASIVNSACAATVLCTIHMVTHCGGGVTLQSNTFDCSFLMTLVGPHTWVFDPPGSGFAACPTNAARVQFARLECANATDDWRLVISGSTLTTTGTLAFCAWDTAWRRPLALPCNPFGAYAYTGSVTPDWIDDPGTAVIS